METFLSALSILGHLDVFIALLIGSIGGVIIGAIPGVGAPVAIAILLPATFAFEPIVGLTLLLGIYGSSMYGGAIPAILINTPGTAVNALTTYDGYPMTKRGEGHRALSLAYSASFFGGIFSVICLIVLSPLLALIAPHFGSREIFLVQMILWSGGLYGLNSICKSSLSQAAGAIVGSARAAISPDRQKPLIGMTSLGSSCLRYMKYLSPALEARGFEVAVFHSTGMGGMAFEKLAGEGAFACVMDFCMQEYGNMLAGSVVTSGEDRLTNASRTGTPQMIAPGALDMLDFAGWQEIPEQYRDRPFHEHNRLIKDSVFNADERRAWIRAIAEQLQSATGPTHFFLPLGGVEEWDREGGPAYDREGLAALIDEARKVIPGSVPMTEVDAHINDEAFSEAVLSLFDEWVADGKVSREC